MYAPSGDTEDPQQSTVTMNASDFAQAPAPGATIPDLRPVTMKASDFAQTPTPPATVTMNASDFGPPQAGSISGMEQLGGTPPPPAKPPTAPGLGPGVLTRSRTGQLYLQPADASDSAGKAAAFLYGNPVTGGAMQAAEGALKVVKQAGPQIGYSQLRAMGQDQQAGPTPPPLDAQQLLSGGSDIMEGGFKMVMPLIPGAALAKPFTTVFTLAGAYGAAKATESTAESLGASPELRRFLGNLAGAGVGIFGAQKVAGEMFGTGGGNPPGGGGAETGPSGPDDGLFSALIQRAKDRGLKGALNELTTGWNIWKNGSGGAAPGAPEAAPPAGVPAVPSTAPTGPSGAPAPAIPPIGNAAEIAKAWEFARALSPAAPSGATTLREASGADIADAWATYHGAPPPARITPLAPPERTPLPHLPGMDVSNEDILRAWDFARQKSSAAPSGATTYNQATNSDLAAAIAEWQKAGSPGAENGAPGTGGTAGTNPEENGTSGTKPRVPSGGVLQGHEEVGPDGQVRTVYTETAQIDPHDAPLLDSILDHIEGNANGRPTTLLDQVVALGGAGDAGDVTPHVDALVSADENSEHAHPDETPEERRLAAEQAVQELLLHGKQKAAAAPAGSGQTDQGANAPIGGETPTSATPAAAHADSASPTATGPRAPVVTAPAEESGAPPVPNDTGLTPEQIRQAAQEIGGTPVGPLPPITAGNEPGTIAPAPNENAAESTNPEETAGIIRPEVLPPITTPAGSPDEPVKPEAALEEEQPKHELASTQANLSGPVADQVRAVGALIPTDQLTKDGAEQQPHITALFGLHADNPDEVRELLKDQPPITVTAGQRLHLPGGRYGLFPRGRRRLRRPQSRCGFTGPAPHQRTFAAVAAYQ